MKVRSGLVFKSEEQSGEISYLNLKGIYRVIAVTSSGAVIFVPITFSRSKDILSEKNGIQVMSADEFNSQGFKELNKTEKAKARVFSTTAAVNFAKELLVDEPDWDVKRDDDDLK